MPSCKQITELASKQLDKPLSRWQKWQLRLHLLICRHCRRYVKQMRFLQRISSHLPTTQVLSAEARERIANNIRQKLKS
jgi:predicted anti-sigma-YlaC factor YlaD